MIARQPLALGDLAEMLVELGGVPAKQVARLNAQTRFADLELDSLAYVALVCAIQDRTGLELASDDLMPLQTPAEMLAYVNGQFHVAT